MIVKHSKIQTIFRMSLSYNNVRQCCLCGREDITGEVCHLGSGGLTTQKEIIKAFDMGILKYEGLEEDKKLIAHRLSDMPLLMTAPGCRECNIKVLKDISVLPRSVLRSVIDVYNDCEFEIMLEALPFVRDFVSRVRYIYSTPISDEQAILFLQKLQTKFRDILKATGNMKKLREIKE